MVRPNKPPFGKKKEDSTRVNEGIQAPKVRLVDENGEMVGVISTKEAVEKARRAGLDLVEVSPNADPPVCKILDYGKYKFQEQKQKAAARKKQKVVNVKEVKIRPGTEEHDYQVKMRNARKFIENGDKVKVSMRFKGREMAHQDLGLKMMERIQQELEDIAKVDHQAKVEGRQAIMVLSPK